MKMDECDDVEGIIISYPRELTDTLLCARPRTYLPLRQQHCNITVKDTAELSGKLQKFCKATKSAHACGNDNGMCVFALLVNSAKFS